MSVVGKPNPLLRFKEFMDILIKYKSIVERTCA